MIADTETPTNETSASERLNAILDQAGFRRERGRIAELHSFICDKIPRLKDINYGTVRSWCTSGTTPPTAKMKLISDSLADRIAAKNAFEGDRESLSEAIKAWWYDGKRYPFATTTQEQELKINYRQGAYRSLEVNDQAKIIALLNSNSTENYSPITDLAPAKLEIILDSIATSLANQRTTEPTTQTEQIVHALVVLAASKIIL